MRYHEIASGIRVVVSSEQQEILDLIGDKTVPNNTMDERQREVARLMVSRGLLDRVKSDNVIALKVNSVKDVWRDRG